jgi:hypothetical protein
LNVALGVLGNGRTKYLDQCVDSIFEFCPPFDAYLMVDDSGDPEVRRELTRDYTDFSQCHHDTNRGMAAGVNTLWKMALETDCDYFVHVEEDFVFTKCPPIGQICDVLGRHPDVAQMLLQRQPLTPAELEAGSVLGAMNPVIYDTWAQQTHIFSLNPMIAPRRVLELGWPSGPIGVGNEAGQTKRLLAMDFVFGVWRDGPLVEHIGAERGSAWQL